MHFLQHLLQNMLPWQVMLLGQDDILPPVGFERVITNTNNFVVTSRGNFVIAKAY